RTGLSGSSRRSLHAALPIWPRFGRPRDAARLRGKREERRSTGRERCGGHAASHTTLAGRAATDGSARPGDALEAPADPVRRDRGETADEQGLESREDGRAPDEAALQRTDREEREPGEERADAQGLEPGEDGGAPDEPAVQRRAGEEREPGGERAPREGGRGGAGRDELGQGGEKRHRTRRDERDEGRETRADGRAADAA